MTTAKHNGDDAITTAIRTAAELSERRDEVGSAACDIMFGLERLVDDLDNLWHDYARAWTAAGQDRDAEIDAAEAHLNRFAGVLSVARAALNAERAAQRVAS